MTIACALLLANPVAAEPAKLGVGLFSPELGLSPYDLFDEIDRIARHLTKKLEVPVVGRSYKTRRDLAADIRANRIQFAVIGGFSIESLSGIVRLLAVGSAGSAGARRKWTLMAREKSDMAAIKGKTLQLPAVSPRVVDFVEHGLLRSNLRLRKFFSINTSPGLFSALEALKVRAATVVLAPAGTEGLIPVLPTSLEVPPPGFVLLSRRLSASTVQRAKRAMLAYRGKSKLLPKFVPGDLSLYRRFAANRRRRRLSMVPTAPDTRALAEKDLLAQQRVVLELPRFDFDKLFETTRAR